MIASDNCLELIRQSEGFESAPYRCPAGVVTIGYGSTRYEDGARVTMRDAPITLARADAIMRVTLKEYEHAVDRYVTVPLKQSQFDALVDFAYNAGAKNLLTSTLLKLLNSGDALAAANQFGLWVHGGGKVLPGLVKRRAHERALFVREGV